MSVDQFRTYFFACGALEVSQARLDGIFATFDTTADRCLTRKGGGSVPTVLVLLMLHCTECH